MRWDLDPLKFNAELRKEHTAIYDNAVKKWGVDAQVAMAIEECGELIVALCHANRNLKEINRESLVEEIGDVSLMLEQLCFILGISPSEWFTVRESKLKRLRGLLTNDKADKD